jgi:hypothetical protein
MSKKTLALTAALAVLCLGSVTAGTLKFGVVADVQYHPGGPDGNRYYRESLAKLEAALARINKGNVQFIVNLGDTIDRQFRAFDQVMPLFLKSKAPVYHLLGNHDLNGEPGNKGEVMSKLGMTESYYSFDKGAWRFIALDGLELRFPAPPDETLRQESEALYWKFDVQGKDERRPWNGGISRKQAGWLEGRLDEADKTRKNVLVFCHFPVIPESTSNLWNDEEVVSILEKHPCVKAYFCGHNHAGGYTLRNGVHYLIFAGMVETPDENAFAVVGLGKDAIQVKGFGREKSRSLALSASR